MRQFFAAFALFVLGAGAHADSYQKYYQPEYEVTITNVTQSLQFTPILVATHRRAISFFELGEPASEGLALLAEGGAIDPLAAELTATGKVIDANNSSTVLGDPPLLFAGDSVTLKVKGRNRGAVLSLAAMLLPTNDSFVALNSVKLPKYGKRVYYALGYDAGSEPNDEYCMNIPGPTCMGTGPSPDEGGEGFVHVSNGIHGGADLKPSVYDWRNPVAKVVVRRVR
ncbi:MAG: spondin domain-containing protein [Pseudomonadota bacterium]